MSKLWEIRLFRFEMFVLSQKVLFYFPVRETLGLRGGLPYEMVRDACQKIWIELLKETNLGVACASFDP